MTPVLRRYIQGFFDGFDEGISKSVDVKFMQSDGGLTDVSNFTGFRAILSGPAGGVVGYGITSYEETTGMGIIGFDMVDSRLVLLTPYRVVHPRIYLDFLVPMTT